MKKSKFLLILATAPVMLIILSSISGSKPLMVEKNLFSKDRAPSSSGDARVGTIHSGHPPRAIQLDGVIFQGDIKEALIRINTRPSRKNSSKRISPFLVVREGESIGEYEVNKINFRSIWLERDGRLYEVSIFSEKPKEILLEASAPVSVATVSGQQAQ